MNHNAPFIISDESHKKSWPTILVTFTLVAFLVAIALLGPVFHLWVYDLVTAIVAAGIAYVFFLFSMISARFIRTFPACAKPVVKLLILIVGTILLMCPVALSSGMAKPNSVPSSSEVNVQTAADTDADDQQEEADNPDSANLVAVKGDPVIPILGAVYAAIKTAALDMAPGDWFAEGQLAQSIPAWLISIHAFCLILFAITCPLVAVYAAFDALVNGLSGTRIRIWSWRKSNSLTANEIYVFHELDAYGATLARSIIKTRKRQLPLLIFANVGDLEASRDDTLMEDLLDYAKGKAFVLFTSLPAETVPSKLSKRALKKCSVRYFAISENSSTNLQTAVGLWDVVFDQLWRETWQAWHKWRNLKGVSSKSVCYGEVCLSIAKAIEMRAGGEVGKPFDENTFKSVMDIGAGLGIHCLHAHPDDEAILDSLVSRSVESIVKQVDEESLIADRTLLYGIKELAGCLRGLVNIRLLSQTELAVNDLFKEHPLYEALDPIALADKIKGRQPQTTCPLLEEQQLTVLVIGCGTYGMQVLKTAFWLGRFAGTKLKIVVVEKDNLRRKMEKLYLTSPGMVTERSYSEHLNGPVEGKWTIETRDDAPTIRFCEMDYFSTDMRRLLSGREVSYLWYEAGEEPTIQKRCETVLGANDHLYCVVCLGDDDTSLNAALDLQRNLAKRKLVNMQQSDVSSNIADKENSCVPIAIRVRNEYAFAADQLSENGLQSDLRELGLKLYPFGSLNSVFSFESIAAETLEAKAMHANATYALAHHDFLTNGRGWMDYRCITEFNKLQNRAVALSLGYKLWMLGLDPNTVSSDMLRNALGGAADFVSRNSDGELFRNGLQVPTVQPDGSIKEQKDEDRVLDPAKDKEFRDKWSLLAYMGDLEHVRWSSFYRTLGWRDSLSVLDTKNKDLCDDGIKSKGSTIEQQQVLRDRLPLRKGTQHLDLRVHYYLCDNIDELGARGIDCGVNPFAYDRMILWYAVEILNCEVCGQVAPSKE